MSSLKIEVHESTNGTTVALQGRLISTELGQLQHACLSALHHLSTSELIIDLSGVEYIDSLSIGRLVALNSTAEKSGKRLVLTHPQPRISEAIKMLHIDRIITLR